MRLLLRFFRRPRPSPPVNDPTISRAGMMTRGARAGDQRHRPTAHERELAQKLGVQAYDPERP
jgi:hypothetical protein